MWIYYEDVGKAFGKAPEEFKELLERWGIEENKIDMGYEGSLFAPWLAIDGDYSLVYIGGKWSGRVEDLMELVNFEKPIEKELRRIAREVENGEKTTEEAKQEIKKLAQNPNLSDEDKEILMALEIDKTGEFSFPVVFILEKDKINGDRLILDEVGEKAKQMEEEAEKEAKKYEAQLTKHRKRRRT